MSAEDYDDVPGLGGSGNFGSYGGSFKPRSYTCNFCKAAIRFTNRKPFNEDGSAHRCMGRQSVAAPALATDNQQAVLFAMAAMNAIISGQIQAGGVDHIHHMNFHDVADAAWQSAAAMIGAEKNYRDEIAAATRATW